jgi:fructokinase
VSILVVGEALVDLILTPDGAVGAIAGGGPFTMARTIARLKVPVSFAGGISDDAFGVRLTELLIADGVRLPLPARHGLLTTLALAEVDNSGAATYRFYTEGTAAPAISADDITVDSQTQVLAVGTLGLVLEPMASTVESLVAAAADETLVFLDPNCRPATVTDRDAYLARLARVLTRADVIKVSRDDLNYICGRDVHANPIHAARGLLAGDTALVLFTDGSEIVHIITRSADIEVPVAPIEIVDTVGAGDAFGGAFIAYWAASGRTRADLGDLDAVRRCVEKAIDVAAITCQRVGADPPHLHELA